MIGDATNLHAWIEQANRLQAEIERIRDSSKEINQQAELSTAVHAQFEDATEKVNLLKTEVDYTNQLEDTLHRIQGVTIDQSATQQALDRSSLELASEGFQKVKAALSGLGHLKHTNAISLLSQKQSRMKSKLVQDVYDAWCSCIRVEGAVQSLQIPALIVVSDEGGTHGWKALMALLSKLDLFDKAVRELSCSLRKNLLDPMLSMRPSANPRPVTVTTNRNRLQIEGRGSLMNTIDGLLQNLIDILGFLDSRLPSVITSQLLEVIIPFVENQLVTQVLPDAIPTSVDRASELHSLLGHVTNFAKYLKNIRWETAVDIEDWISNAPRNWLAKRREFSIAHVRVLLSMKLHETKQVEKVETQLIGGGDVLASHGESTDDWNNDWLEKGNTAHPVKEGEISCEEEDTSAWDVEDGDQASQLDRHPLENASHGATNGNAEEDGDAWGWDDPNPQSNLPSPAKPRHQISQVNGSYSPSKVSKREVTLRENYIVSAIPDELLELILQIVHDAQTLRQPENASLAIAPAALGLYSIPTLTLAGFRALSPSYYENIEGGNMFLYNDSTRLAEELSTLAVKIRETDVNSTQPQHSWASNRMKLEAEIAALQSFGRRAYGKEMESQRTILRDLIDGAQGFANCTEAPFAAECDNAISMTTDHLRSVGGRFEKILSRSALLQSLGSLLSTVISKVILDIEDMSDIGEEESKRLRHFCNEIGMLSDLFMQESEGGSRTDVTGIYAPSWFKFKYLSEILESTLADIMYLWTEGELKLEFEPSELIDLIEALFADSDRRRKAILDIKRI